MDGFVLFRSVLAQDLVFRIKDCRLFKGTRAVVKACNLVPTIMCVRYGFVPSQLQHVRICVGVRELFYVPLFL